jgi:hypothetical protein
VAKVKKAARAMAPMSRSRTVGFQVKRAAWLAVLRPCIEHGAEAWHPTPTQVSKQLESLQMEVLKHALHLHPKASHACLQQELGLTPLEDLLDTRLLCFKKKLEQMAEDRLPKQTLMADWGRAMKGKFPTTWEQKAEQVEKRLGVKTSELQNVRSELPAYIKLARERTLAAQTGPTWEDWAKHLGPPCAEPHAAQPYLCKGPGTRGKELLLQLRVGCLQLRCLTSKYGRTRGEAGEPEDDTANPYTQNLRNAVGGVPGGARGGTLTPTDKTNCPACQGAAETTGHFMWECPAYTEVRGPYVMALQEANPQAWAALQAEHDAGERVWKAIDTRFWAGECSEGGPETAATDNSQSHWVHSITLVQNLVYALWRARGQALQYALEQEGGVQRDGRGGGLLDGSAAAADSTPGVSPPNALGAHSAACERTTSAL